MISQKQLLANRQNAQRSTGPRSIEGKAIASQNAIRHGLRAEQTVIPGEDPAEFEQFRQLLLDDLAPAGALEACLVDQIVAAFWKLRRAGRIETELLKEFNRTAAQDEDKKDSTELPFNIRVTHTYTCPVHGKKLSQETPTENCESCPVSPKADTPERLDGKPVPVNMQHPDNAGDPDRQQLALEEQENQPRPSKPPALGRIFRRDFAGSCILSRFRQYEGQIERGLYKALTELQKVQLLRSKLWVSGADSQQESAAALTHDT